MKKTVLNEIDVTDDRIQFIFKHTHIHHQKILDVGCGKGAMCKKFEERAADVYGIDMDPEVLAIAKERLERTRLVEADVSQDLPFSDDCFDMAVASEVLEHIHYWPITVSEMVRVLKPGGKLFIIDKNNKAFWHKVWFVLNFIKLGEGLKEFISNEQWFDEEDVAVVLRPLCKEVTTVKLNKLFIGWFAVK